MALVTKADLITLDFAFQGQPFCVIAKDNTVDFGTLDWAFSGQPLTPYTGGTMPSGGDMRATQVGTEAWYAGTPAMAVTQVGAEVWYGTRCR
jgi:hypothetical protein